MTYFGFTSSGSVATPGGGDGGGGGLLGAELTGERWPQAQVQPPVPGSNPPDNPHPLDAVIISDLHLGSDNCQAKPLCQFLEQILSGDLPTTRLIINGDVFDSIDFRRLRKTHWKVLSLIRHLSDKIEVIWIVGNHDGSAEIVSHLLGVTVREEYILHSGGQKILAIHGHAFDKFIDNHPLITWLADCLYAGLQKLDRTHYVARLAKRKSKTFLHCLDKIERGAIQRAKQRHCQAVICGHTHHGIAKTDQEIPYFNSGCWTEKNEMTFLTVAHAQCELHHFCPTPDSEILTPPIPQLQTT